MSAFGVELMTVSLEQMFQWSMAGNLKDNQYILIYTWITHNAP